MSLIDLAERGLLPDALVRLGIRRLCGQSRKQGQRILTRQGVSGLRQVTQIQSIREKSCGHALGGMLGKQTFILVATP